MKIIDSIKGKVCQFVTVPISGFTHNLTKYQRSLTVCIIISCFRLLPGEINYSLLLQPMINNIFSVDSNGMTDNEPAGKLAMR